MRAGVLLLGGHLGVGPAAAPVGHEDHVPAEPAAPPRLGSDGPAHLADAEPLPGPVGGEGDAAGARPAVGEAVEKQLGVMDLTALTMCMEHKLPLIVFDYKVPGNITRAVRGEPIGTLVKA